jgi:small-conductance mechanosensitive channel
LLLERPFTVGDTIKSGDVIGIAESVDLLAVRVRTRDNKLVRIPNEMVLKQSLTNLTYYPIKRIDVMLSVSYEKDLEAVIGQIRNLIAQDKLFLTHPAPVILISKIGQLDYDSQIRSFLSIRVWVATDKFTYATSVLIGQIKNEFEDDTVTVMPIN